VRSLAERLGLTNVAAAYLLKRGITEEPRVGAYLDPDPKDFIYPSQFAAMDEMAELIGARRSDKGGVLVYGDYDVDGVIGAFILFRALQYLRVPSNYFLPSRRSGGYGLSIDTLSQAVGHNYKTLIAVDCGIAEHDAVAVARASGMDVFILDHHQTQGALPDALIANPVLEPTENPLCSAALAYVFAEKLLADGDEAAAMLTAELFPFVALATVADVVQLVADNRIFAALGLKALSAMRGGAGGGRCNPGLKCLMDAALPRGSRRVTAEHVAFQLAPRINAAGRMSDAKLALKLFLADNHIDASRQASHLVELNRGRQAEQESALREAMRQTEGGRDAPAIVVAKDSWNVGLIGVIAGKLAETYGKPAFVFCRPNDETTMRGSARSAAGVNLKAALDSLKDILAKYGGHPEAAGLDVEAARMDDFRGRICGAVSAQGASAKAEPFIALDADATLDELGEALLPDLLRLEPFGRGNAPPVVAVTGATVAAAREVGRDSTHLRLVLKQGEATAEVVGFSMAHLLGRIEPGKTLCAALSPVVSDFGGGEHVELRLLDAHF